MMIGDKVGAPPFAPSAQFPWGSDVVGRDVQALVLAGARQTLVLAVLGMMARMLFGAVLGALAGWWQGSWLDRLINSVVAVWAAFPVTILPHLITWTAALSTPNGVWTHTRRHRRGGL